MLSKWVFWLSALVFVTAVYLLVTGSPLLLISLNERMGLPLGNLVAWLGMLSLVLMVAPGWGSLWVSNADRDRVFCRLWWLLLAMVLAWPLIGFALAGNWSNSFSGSAPGFRGSPAASRVMFSYSAAAVILPLLFVLVRWLHLRRRQSYSR